jgi:hypothetical protein
MHQFASHDENDADPLRKALAGLDLTTQQILAETVALLREHPLWAVWIPRGRRDWTAARPASSQPPGPDLPMFWIHAATSAQLADLMDAADTQLPANQVFDDLRQNFNLKLRAEAEAQGRNTRLSEPATHRACAARHPRARTL